VTWCQHDFETTNLLHKTKSYMFPSYTCNTRSYMCNTHLYTLYVQHAFILYTCNTRSYTLYVQHSFILYTCNTRSYTCNTRSYTCNTHLYTCNTRSYTCNAHFFFCAPQIPWRNGRAKPRLQPRGSRLSVGRAQKTHSKFQAERGKTAEKTRKGKRAKTLDLPGPLSLILEE
jgi:hypothetical protein